MLYMKLSDGKHLVILDQANLGKMKEGKPAHSPDEEVFIAYQPDLSWTAAVIVELMKKNIGISGEELNQILTEGMKQPIHIHHEREDEPYERLESKAPQDY